MKFYLDLFIIFFSVNLFAQETHVKIFPFKSAIIEYKYEGGLEGTHVKYIDDYGYKQADFIRKEFNGDGDLKKEYEDIILVGQRAYTVNYNDSTVAIGVNSTYNYYLKYNKSPSEITEALTRAEGFELNGKEEFLNIECKSWKAQKANKLTWEGIDLKSTTTFMMVEKAISIKTDIEIPENIFSIPQGFRYISSDVYQGYSDLKLEFDTVNRKPEVDSDHIKIEFNSLSLENCSAIPFYTQEGDSLIQNGDNDYNKVDLKIIKSQIWNMNPDVKELPKYSTLVFYQKDGYGKGYDAFGKVQINKIDKDLFTYRYIIFGNEGEITGYSEDVNNALINIFEIRINKGKLTFKPKSKTISTILGW